MRRIIVYLDIFGYFREAFIFTFLRQFRTPSSLLFKSNGRFLSRFGTEVLFSSRPTPHTGRLHEENFWVRLILFSPAAFLLKLTPACKLSIV